MTSAPDNPGSQNRGTTSQGSQPVARAATSGRTVRQDVVAQQKERFGGMHFGTAFFGWLTATGAAVLLTALVAGAGTAVGLGTEVDPNQAADAATENAATIGLIGAITLAVVVFVAYLCGGYVAGRMARFSGAKQGVAVWLWALIVAVVLAIVGAVAGNQFNVLAEMNSFPRIPVNEGDLAAGSIIAVIAIAIVSLGGAVLGGISGMRYHRKVDKADLGNSRHTSSFSGSTPHAEQPVRQEEEDNGNDRQEQSRLSHRRRRHRFR